eukprot:CAMPEP_0181332044 /NCGR_PEP_ID=MMETSP1101-20121128/24858_1 /TAXON_ID=46948 /ORGANISM="Rhodomonas abbreviata, Strain Caron Lab Isolate" /LENGTH=273 /DNA_ID=CAMNT_0023441611 /DNA_START=493 /DNA_END=1314 /DNA_ORIENTATION=-
MTLLLRIRQFMHNNSYHNWHHVVDVAQAACCFGALSGIFNSMPAEHRFALLVGALCHDLDHPGLNLKEFCDSNESVVALFGGSSLLERRHSFVAVQILSSQDLDLRNQLGNQQYFDFLDAVSSSILATDMEKHAEFQRSMSTSGLAEDDFRKQTAFLLKCADLSNVTRPEFIAKKWGWLITEEIFRQDDAEKTCGGKAPLERRLLGRVALIRGFTESVAQSFFQCAAAVTPGLTPLVGGVARNLISWRATEEEVFERDGPSLHSALPQPPAVH